MIRQALGTLRINSQPGGNARANCFGRLPTGFHLAKIILAATFLFLFLTSGRLAIAEGNSRTWTDSLGRQKEAEFIKYDEGQVELKFEDGRYVKCQVVAFSEPDQKYIWDYVHYQNRKAKGEKVEPPKDPRDSSQDTNKAAENANAGKDDNDGPQELMKFKTRVWNNIHENRKLQAKLISVSGDNVYLKLEISKKAYSEPIYHFHMDDRKYVNAQLKGLNREDLAGGIKTWLDYLTPETKELAQQQQPQIAAGQTGQVPNGGAPNAQPNPQMPNQQAPNQQPVGPPQFAGDAKPVMPDTVENRAILERMRKLEGGKGNGARPYGTPGQQDQLAKNDTNNAVPVPIFSNNTKPEDKAANASGSNAAEQNNQASSASSGSSGSSSSNSGTPIVPPIFSKNNPYGGALSSDGPSMLTFVNGLHYVGRAIAGIGLIWVIVLGFTESLAWGLACFIPIVNLVFIAKHWEKSQGAFGVFLFGCIIKAVAVTIAIQQGYTIIRYW